MSQRSSEELANAIREDELFQQRNADVSTNRNTVTIKEYDRPDTSLAERVEKIAQEVVGVEKYSMQTTTKEYTIRVFS